MFELVDSAPQSAVIKVIGVGGGGGNAVRHMIDHHVDGVDFICANTDAQALSDISSKTVLQLGASITKGLGAGANPEVGRAAALEDRDRIADALHGTDMVFVTAGMGGGTGTGAAPIVAEVARELGILTVAVVTRPFSFEGKKRVTTAEDGLKEIAQHCDSLITIPNEKLLEVLGKNTSLLDAFKEANDVLLGAVQGIADLIIRPGLVNVDFADVRTVMSEMGAAMMGTGTASGEDRAREAAERAINSPLLDDIDLSGARAPLKSISSSNGLLIARSAASRARSSPLAVPVPIIAAPISDITVRTSAKSTLTKPGRMMRSAIPWTAPSSTSFASLNASNNEVFLPSTSSSFSLGIVIKESQCCAISLSPSSAVVTRFLPSKLKGRVTTATVKIPSSRATSATIGAAPVPVPPPIPAVTNTISVPCSASAIRSRSSSAAARPTSGLAPAPSPFVMLAPN